ncbi:MAG: hypothetical protein U0905_18975 [Pirellulales bacterium]
MSAIPSTHPARVVHPLSFGSVWWTVHIVITTIGIYLAQTLIYDESRWYRIDYPDAMVWGLLVTQIFDSLCMLRA